MNIISKKAKIGKNVKFGNFVTIHDDVEIGDNSIIESYCELGYSNGNEKGLLKIGKNSLIRSHSVLYAGSKIGENFLTGHHVMIRENMKIGLNFQAGSYTDLEGESKIGDYVHAHSNVHIGQFSKIGNFVNIFPYALLTNDRHPPSDGYTKGPTVNDFAVLGVRCIIFPNIKIGKDAVIGAGCILRQDVPDGFLAIGNPSRLLGPASNIMLYGTKKPAYPWRYHFHRGYPKNIVESWKKEANEISKNK